MEPRWIMLLVLFLVRLAMGYQFQSVASISPLLARDLGQVRRELGLETPDAYGRIVGPAGLLAQAA